MHPFQKANILLPNGISMERWSVIACDQFASQPEYWDQVRQFAGNSPSAVNLILPESDLGGDCDAAIQKINDTMYRYLQEQVFRLYPDSFVYVERTLLNGAVRKGVVGAVDLQQYDFRPESGAAIRATEETVAERIPPRMNIRRNAPLELPHVLLLCDDEEKQLVESLTAKKDSLPLLYDFDLMLGGGRIRGWLVAGEDADIFTNALNTYGQRMQQKYPSSNVLMPSVTATIPLPLPRAATRKIPPAKMPGTPWWSWKTSMMKPRSLNPSTVSSKTPIRRHFLML